jgi:hypothetical protein
MNKIDLDKLFRQWQKVYGFGPLTPEEAEKACDDAIPEPMTKEEIDKIAKYVLDHDDRDPNKGLA